jgi:hypothetical protein
VPDETRRRSEAAKREVKRWHENIRLADRLHQQWEKEVRAPDCERAYYGEQWPKEFKTVSRFSDPYVINLFFPTIEAKLPSLYFYRPSARVLPRPTRVDDPLSALTDRARLREDILNTYIHDPRLNLGYHVNQALKDAFFRFGILEWGYSANFIDNPALKRPRQERSADEMSDEDEADLPARVLDPTDPDEHIFLRWIPAKTFRVSLRSTPLLHEADWCGYYEWHYLDDLKRNRDYSNRDALKVTARSDMSDGSLRVDYSGSMDASDWRKGMTRIWKIWDLRARERFIIADGLADKYLLKPRPFLILPFSDFRFHNRLEGYYPLPPCTNWLYPQQELNETRESQRVHRRRAYRRFQHRKGSVDAEELSKLVNGGDMTIIATNEDGAIRPIEDAPLDAAVHRNVPQSREDFMQISGVGGEQRLVPEATTATQASIIDSRAKIRDSFSREAVGEWLARGFSILLRHVEAYVALPFWVQRLTDPLSPAAQPEADAITQTWAQVKAEELGDLTYDVEVAVESLSPVNEDIDRQNWLQVLGLLQNPSLLLVLSNSDSLLRRTLRFFNIKSGRDVEDIRTAMQAALMAIASMQQAKAGPGPGAGQGAGPGGNGVSQGTSPGPAPGPANILAQLGMQGLLPTGGSSGP